MLESNEKLLIDIRELSALTGLSVGTLFHWAADGRMPCVRLSARCLRFRPQEIEAWLASFSTSVNKEPMRSASQNRHGTAACGKTKKTG